jgi:hypothetical protein
VIVPKSRKGEKYKEEKKRKLGTKNEKKKKRGNVSEEKR